MPQSYGYSSKSQINLRQNSYFYCWHDYRSRSKTKQAEINKERRKTRAQRSTVLTPNEEEIVGLIPSSLTKGHANVLESYADMTFGEKDLNDSSSVEAEEIEFLDDINVQIQASLSTSAIQTTIKTSNITYNDEDTENYDPSKLKKSKRSSSRQRVNEVQKSTCIITEVAEKTYLLKKKFCEEIVNCKKKMATAQERLATVAEKCATENCKIM